MLLILIFTSCVSCHVVHLQWTPEAEELITSRTRKEIKGQGTVLIKKTGERETLEAFCGHVHILIYIRYILFDNITDLELLTFESVNL